MPKLKDLIGKMPEKKYHSARANGAYYETDWDSGYNKCLDDFTAILDVEVGLNREKLYKIVLSQTPIRADSLGTLPIEALETARNNCARILTDFIIAAGVIEVKQ